LTVREIDTPHVPARAYLHAAEETSLDCEALAPHSVGFIEAKSGGVMT
jgi:hypothetical protein